MIPPLIIDWRYVDRFIDAFTGVIDEAHSGGGLIWNFGKSLVKDLVAH